MKGHQPSPDEADKRYLKVFLPTMVVYSISCFATPALIANSELPKAANIFLALIPAFAIWVAIWSQARLIRETDEYLRRVLTDASLLALALVMAFATGWGFLEINAGAPKFPLLMILPAFYLCFGLVRFVLWMRDQRA